MEKKVVNILELSLAFFVSISMFLYGIGKPLQFSISSEYTKKVSELSGQELMWVFYGHSKIYAIILGIFEIATAFLLLFLKTRIIGAFLGSSILFNVIVQDIIYDVNRGALRSACIYQLALLIILLLNWQAIQKSFQTLTKYLTESKMYKKRQYFLIGTLIAILIKFLEVFAINTTF
jgi:hypothetical protein